MNENTLKEFALVKHVTIIVRVTFFTLWKISYLRPEMCFVKARLPIHIHSWRQRITWSWRSTKCKCGSVRRKFYLWDLGSSLLFVTSEYHVIVLLSLSQRGEVPLTFSLIGEIAVRFTQIVHKERSKTSHWQQVYYPDYKWTSLSDFKHVYYENEFTNQSDLFLDRKQRMLCIQLPDSTFSYLLL